MKKIDELKATLREKADRLGELSQVRELTDAQKQEVAQLEREYKNISRQLEVEVREAQLKALEKPAPKKSVGEQLREIAKDAIDHKQAREISLSVLTEGDKNNIVSAGAQATTIFGLLPLLEKGLIGPNSAEKRLALLQRLSLPAHLTPNAMLAALNLLLTREEWEKL